MKLKVPNALIHGHQNLIEEMERVIAIGGRIAEKAKILKNVMIVHFKKEEDYALPPLGLLLSLTEGSWQVNAEEAIKMADNLQSRLEEMTQDHLKIVNILNELKLIVEEEKNIVAKYFIKDLMLHIELEDEVLYPTTILVGNYLKKISEI